MGRPLRVFVVCAGLGRVRRGFESFTRELYEALGTREDLDVFLFQGVPGATEREGSVPHLHRGHPLAAALSRLSRKPTHWIEHVTYGLGLIPAVKRLRPDVVYVSEQALGTVLRQWRRRASGQDFTIVLSNSGPYWPPYADLDVVHQVTRTNLEVGLDAGFPAERQVLIPMGFHIPAEYRPVTPAEKRELRERFGLPVDRPILLSVGAIGRSHKRMDYLVEEVASLPEPRPFVLMLGAKESETAGVLEVAESALGAGNYRAESVPPGDMPAYYRCADAFVLASLFEGFGRVYVEAMGAGLPCFVHDYGVTRDLLGEHAHRADLSQKGSLAGLLSRHFPAGAGAGSSGDEAGARARHAHAYESFSWDRLLPEYVALLQAAHAARAGGSPGARAAGALRE